MSRAVAFKCRVCRFARQSWRLMAEHYRQSPGHRPIYIMRHKGQG